MDIINIGLGGIGCRHLLLRAISYRTCLWPRFDFSRSSYYRRLFRTLRGSFLGGLSNTGLDIIVVRRSDIDSGGFLLGSFVLNCRGIEVLLLVLVHMIILRSGRRRFGFSSGRYRHARFLFSSIYMLKSLLRGGVRRRSFGLRRIFGGTKPLVLGHVHSRGSGIISYRRRLPVLGGGDGAAVVEDLLDERFRLLLQKLLLLARLGVGFGLVLFSSLDFGLRLRRRRGFDSGGGLMVVITVTHRVQLVALGGRLLFAVAAAVVLVVRIAARGRRQGLRGVRLLLFHWQFFLYRELFQLIMCFRGISLRYARGLDVLTVGLGGLGRILSLCWFRSIYSGRCSRLILFEILDRNFLRSRRLLGGTAGSSEGDDESAAGGDGAASASASGAFSLLFTGFSGAAAALRDRVLLGSGPSDPAPLTALVLRVLSRFRTGGVGSGIFNCSSIMRLISYTRGGRVSGLARQSRNELFLAVLDRLPRLLLDAIHLELRLVLGGIHVAVELLLSLLILPGPARLELLVLLAPAPLALLVLAPPGLDELIRLGPALPVELGPLLLIRPAQVREQGVPLLLQRVEAGVVLLDRQERGDRLVDLRQVVVHLLH
ncbi:uncharacterized protein PG998_004259 [Apiospora kogelbergensis]|uniref:uncharacterized protein n=1 Tax=Apiospora kogelbergensis TaxID=1337665 RepID=UPI00312E96CB